MKRKLLSLLSLILVVAMAFSACDLLGGGTDDTNDDGKTEECVHTYSDAWTSNAEYHWHVATCEHTEERSALDYHADSDEDGKCDVCQYNVTHTHTFKPEWTFDEEGHWHAATCSHTEAKGSYGLHFDVNANGKCDACGAEVTVEIDSKDALISFIGGTTGGVVSGTVSSFIECISLGKDGTATSSTSAEYTYGDNCFYYKNTTTAYTSLTNVTATSTYEKWQEYVTDQIVFGVFTENGSPLAMDGAATLDSIKGHYFAVSTLANAYGAENVLYELYKLSQEASASEYTWTYDDTTLTAAFTFNYTQINTDVAEGEDPNVNYYEVSVSFTHNENYVLTNLAIECKCYSNSLEDEKDHDFTYDPETGVLTMKPEGEYQADTYTFTVTQVAGDRTYVNENPRSKFLPETFELYTDEELTTVVEETITVSANTVLKFYLGNFLPEGTSISFAPDSLQASLTGDSTDFILFHNPIDCDITANIHAAGVYTLTVSIGNANDKVITLNVVEDLVVDPVRTLAGEWEVTLGASDNWKNMTESELFSFTATESGNYTFILPAECGAYDRGAYDNTFGNENAIGAFIDPFAFVGGQYDGGEFTVFIEAGQTYQFYIRSYIAQTVTITCMKEAY